MRHWIWCDIDQIIPIFTSASPRSILVLSGRYHIISNASLVNNCILLYNEVKRPIFIGLERSRGQSTYCHIHWLARTCRWILVTKIRLEELPPVLRPRRIRLHVFVTSFKRKTTLHRLTPWVTCFPVTNDVSYHIFSLRFQSCELLFDLSHYFNIGSTGEAC